MRCALALLALLGEVSALVPGAAASSRARPLPAAAARRSSRARACAAPVEAPSLLDEFCLLSGRVTSGYGRGSKQIGVPTANLPSSALAEGGTVEFLSGGGAGAAAAGSLDALPRGVYVAWAGLRGAVYPAVVNVGLSPTFEDAQNPETIAEAHILDPIESDFYGEQLTLILLGFIRPERKFPSFDELLAAIRSDIATSGSALGLPAYAACAELPRFVESVPPPAATEGEGGAAKEEEDDDDDGFSFMAPPEGVVCDEDGDECVIPDMDDDDDE